MATTKKVNYTEEETQKVLDYYNKGTGKTVEEIAQLMGKGVKSIVAKLSRCGVYKPQKAYKTKTGEEPIKKDDLADKIGVLLPSLTENDIESLAKANKVVLQTIFNALSLTAKQSHEARSLDNDQETESTDNEVLMADSPDRR